MSNDAAQRYRFGFRAETVAVWLLRLKGYRILARRLRTPLGEIDIVALRGRTIAIVEVKSSVDLESALRALSERQRERITRAARWFLAANPRYEPHTVRFDFVVVSALAFMPVLLWPRHYSDAWQAH